MMMASSDKDQTSKRSLVIRDMPEEFINRDILKEHFQKFGNVERLACSVSKKYAVIHFSTQEEADNALKNGTKIRENATPLKIYHSEKFLSAGNSAQTTKAVEPSVSRLVTKRKIVRTFSNSGAAATTSFAPSTSQPSTVVEPDAAKHGQFNPSNPLGPLRSSIKISRPSPFLRKRPSFGDKSGKASVPPGAQARNPFAIPPRSALSFDRRKKVPETSTIAAKSETDGDRLDVEVKAQKLTSSAISHELEFAENNEVVDTDRVQLDTVPDPDTVSGGPSAAVPQQKSEISAPHGKKSQIEPSSVDIDETTEDVAENDENAAEAQDEMTEDNDIRDESQSHEDNAEATTEEEGEILGEEEEEDDDDDDDEDDYDEEEGGDVEDTQEQEDDAEQDAYESPMKRFEAKASAGKSDSSASAPSTEDFSFKLPSKSSDKSASSLFKLPFVSPFASGNVPKPFTSSSFGISLNISNTSKSLASGPTGIFGSALADKNRTDNQSQSEPVKEIVKKPDPSDAEKPKTASAPPFGLFTVTGSSTSRPLSFGTASTKPSTSTVSKIMQPVSTSAQQMVRRPTAKPSSSLTATVQQSQKDAPNPLLLTFYPDTPEAQELFSRRATTVEDKYRTLEARDKIIRARIPKTKVNVEFATKLVGTCSDMCPEKERYMRQFQRQLVPYETLPGAEVAVDHQRAIKVYSRSSADQEEPLPHELRPGPTLDYTMHYLLINIVPLGDSNEENLSDWYNFLWDRTRSIRKDITQQQITDLTAVCLFEKCARFHIHCASRLCQLDVHSFDPKLNDENLMKCLQSLEHLYEDLRRRQVVCPNEPEFRGYRIMMNLNEGDALYNAQQLPDWILNSNEVQTALKLHHSIFTKNFVAFFRTVKHLPYMTSCILHRYFFQVRSIALRCCVKAHCTLPKYETAMPMSTLQRMLGYGMDEAQAFSYLCEAHGIHCDAEENRIILKRKLFYLPDAPLIYREPHLVDSKLRTSVAESINGGPLPDIDFANRRPCSSFNENGQLIAGAVIGTRLQESKSQLLGEPTSQENPVKVAPPVLLPSQLFKPVLVSGNNTFVFGDVFQQRKEPQIPKPSREIDAACQIVATKLIDESVMSDVVQLSAARLDEARKAQDAFKKRKRQEAIAIRVALEWVEKTVEEHIQSAILSQSTASVRRFKTVENVCQNAAAGLLEQGVVANVTTSAREELMKAKEFHHRRLMTLKTIFERLRARLAIEKWIKVTKKRKREREMQEEKRRIELWNFPAINAYSSSTKEVFKAFCGKSMVQPSTNKVNYLLGLGSPEKNMQKSLENSTIRAKRKSDGEATAGEEWIPKIPKLTQESADPHFALSEMENGIQNRLKELWEFPVINPYNKTNRQVLAELCGTSHINNPQSSSMYYISPVSFTRESDNFANSSQSEFHNSAVAESSSTNEVSEEIKRKSSETTTHFMEDIQKFISDIREETKQFRQLDEQAERLNAVKANCPELCTLNLTLNPPSVSSGNRISTPLGFDYMDTDEMISDIVTSNLSNTDLLSCIKHFANQVREEKAKSWNVDTFLNDIDLAITQ